MQDARPAEATLLLQRSSMFIALCVLNDQRSVGERHVKSVRHLAPHWAHVINETWEGFRVVLTLLTFC
jgi:hypothetical protein